MSITSLMISKCDVQTLSTSQDSMLGMNESYTTRLLEQPCRVRVLSAREMVQLGSEKNVATHRFYFEKGTDVRGTDRITNVQTIRNGQTVSTDTNNYDVVFPTDPNRMGKFVQCDAILRQQARISTS